MPPEFDIATERVSPRELFTPGLSGVGVAASLGRMHFEGLANAARIGRVSPHRCAVPITDLTKVLTMPLIMSESTGKFAALREMCGKSIKRSALCAGRRTDVQAKSASPEMQS